MATPLDFILDRRPERDGGRGHKPSPVVDVRPKPVAFPDSEKIVSAGALRRDAIYRRSLLAADLIAGITALVFAVVVVAGGTLHAHLHSLLAIPAIVVSGKLLGLYDRDELVFHKSTLDEAPKHFQLATLYTLAAWLLAPAIMDGPFTREAGVALLGSSFVLTSVARHFARAAARQFAPPERCLIIGRSGTRMRLAAKLTAAQRRTEVVGHLPLDEERARRGPWDGKDRRRRDLGLADLPALVRQLDVHRVVLIPGHADSDTMIDAISRAKASGAKVSILPRLFEVVGSSVEFDDIEGVTLLGVRRFGLSRSSAFIKRVMDVVCATAGLVLLAPLFAVVAVAIKLDSRGPVFFRQTRVGRNGKPFRMLKFRSMVDGADAQRAALAAHRVPGNQMFKVVDDPRITRVGSLLRKLSVDELPQLVNVLRGQMSLVGPRPLITDEDGHIEGRFRRRLRLVPGITGPWQILGPTRVPLSEMVTMDYLYGANWSLWLDIKILLRTAGHVLARRGV